MLTLYTSTLVDAKPETAASRIAVQIPRKNGTYDRSKYSEKPQRNDRLAKDEQSFQEQYLSTSSSIYFRSEKHYPHSFLWRVIASKILEIKPADLSRPEKDPIEAYLTLALEFQDPILPLGVSFADSNNSDELHVFVGTTKNDIHNFRLSANIFKASSNVPSDLRDWCKPVDVSSLSIDTVYQLYASNPYELFVAFTGGRIQRLHRKADQERWDPDYYDDASWGSTIRGMVSRRGPQHVDYGASRLALTTAQGMVASTDTTYLYTLCLNHTLRVWQLSTGKLVETRDLLDVAREPNERLQLNPAEPGLIRLVTFPRKGYSMLVTYTPHEGGQFKFWTLKGGLTGSLEIEDRYPSVHFSPPDPDPTGNTVWSLTGFEVIPARKDTPAQIWLLWRNNNYHQIYTMHFDDLQVLPEAWDKNWVTVDSRQSRPQAPDVVLTDPQDVTSKWLTFLFYPGRYSIAVLETALTRYSEITGAFPVTSQRSKPLAERLCAVIASSTTLRKYDNAEMDYGRFLLDTDHQWRNYWRILESLNNGRLAPLSLAFDLTTNMVWVAMADRYAAVRECSKSELLTENDPEALEFATDVFAARWPHRKVADDNRLFASMARVLHAAHKFRRSFSPDLENEFHGAMDEELFTEPDAPTSERIVLIFNQVDFSEGLSEGAEQQLLKDLEPLKELGGLSSDLVFAIINLLSAYNNKRHKISLRNTSFGARVVSAALLHDIELTRKMLLDILTLVIFIDSTDNFDPAELFDALVVALREQERHFWASTHFRSISANFSAKQPGNSSTIVASEDVGHQRTVSIMEDVFMRSIRPQPADTRPAMYLLTDMVAEIQKWASGHDSVTYDDATVHVQCYLLVNNEMELATAFLKFQPRTPWSSYVKGRLRLAKGDHAGAALSFRESAHTLAQGKAIGDVKEMSAGLLSLLDAEHFNSGLPRYFQHIMALFEAQKAFFETAEFAKLSLETLTPDQRLPAPNFKSEILARLFTAELRTARFDLAFQALVQFSDRALQKSSTAALINSVLDPKTSTTNGADALRFLQRLPWSDHPHIAGYLDQHLASLAKNQSSIPFSGTQWSSGTTTDYSSVLCALRLSRNDYRGATAVLFDRLRLVQRSGRARSDPHATALRHALLSLINAMTCVATEEAYILADIDNDPRNQSFQRSRPQSEETNHARKRKRIIITLNDLRREYQLVLDKCSRVERGDFNFQVGESDEEDGDHNESDLAGDIMEL